MISRRNTLRGDRFSLESVRSEIYITFNPRQKCARERFTIRVIVSTVFIEKKNEREIAEIARRYRTIRGVSCVEGLQIHVSKFERQKSHKVDTTLGGRGSTSQKTRGSRAFVISHLVR